MRRDQIVLGLGDTTYHSLSINHQIPFNYNMQLGACVINQSDHTIHRVVRQGSDFLGHHHRANSITLHAWPI